MQSRVISTELLHYSSCFSTHVDTIMRTVCMLLINSRWYAYYNVFLRAHTSQMNDQI
jgi:hypothetical protein